MPLQLSAMAQARAPMASRARYLTANNSLAASGVSALVSGIVGAGIKPQSAHPDEAVRKEINAAFARWVDESDADQLTDFFGIQSTAVRRMVIDGDVFATFAYDGPGRVPMRIRLVDAEQVVSSLTIPGANGSLIVNGVEVDANGKRSAIHLYEHIPGLPFGAPIKYRRIPASDILAMFRPEVPGQVRGVSWFASVLLRLNDLDQTHDAQIMRQKIAALLAGFIVSPDGQIGFDGERSGGTLEPALEPGTLSTLLPGQDVRFSNPATIGAEVNEFMRITAREIAAGLGVPYEVLTGDLTSVNYSSIRAGLVEYRRRLEAIQFGVVAFQFLRPIWRRFITAAVLSGAIDGRGFEQDPEAFFAVNWIPPAFPWVDPLKDVEADIAAIGAGLLSRRQAVAARGFDLEALDAEIAADKANADALGLTFSFNVPPPAPAADPEQA